MISVVPCPSGRTARPPTILSLLVALALAAGCEAIFSEPELDPDDVPPSAVLELRRTGGDQPLLADGASRDTLEARIPKGASTRVVTFTTSRGKFLLSPGKQEIKVRAEPGNDPTDERLIARTVLVADTLPGEAVISASVGEFTRYIVVPFIKR